MKFCFEDVYIRAATIHDMKNVINIASTYFLDVQSIDYNNCCVALFEEKIIGFVYCQNATFYELHTIAVHPNYKGKNIGSLLIKYIVYNHAKNKKIYVCTTSPIFFKKNGFMTLSLEKKKKLWEDCEICDHFNDCKQTAMYFMEK